MTIETEAAVRRLYAEPTTASDDVVGQALADLRKAFPDLTATVDSVTVDGDTARVRASWRGQHIGYPYLGIEPSGWRCEWTSDDTWTVTDDVVVSGTVVPDDDAIRSQITRVPTPGSLDDDRAIVTRYVWKTNSADFDAFDDFVVPDYVDHDPVPGQEPGIEGLKNAYRGFLAGFPDVFFVFEDLIAEGGMVVGRGVIYGTHTGEFAGMPATGAKIRWTGTRIFRVRDRKVVEGWINLDFMGVIMQIKAALDAQAAPSNA